MTDAITSNTRRRGRPAKPFDSTRGSLTIRMRAEIRSGIERAAAANGRSLSEEVEHRLEMSFVIPPPEDEARTIALIAAPLCHGTTEEIAISRAVRLLARARKQVKECAS